MTNRTASNDSEFAAARTASVSGDTIELTGSNYSAFRWDTAYTSDVTVFATDPNNKPRIGTISAFALQHVGAKHIRFENIAFHRPYKTGDSDLKNTIKLDNTDNIFFSHCEISGGVRPDSAVIGRGVNGAGNSNTTLSHCVLHGLTKGLTGGFDNLLMTYCEINNIRSDGLTLGGSSGTTIEYCWFHDFQTLVGSGAHPDMIQVQRSSGSGFYDFTFRYNVLDVGKGNYCQLLFSGNSGQSNGPVGDPVRHTNWHIHDNIIYGDHSNMCVVTWCDGLIIEHNTLIRTEAGNNGGSDTSINVSGDSTNVIIRENIVKALTREQPAWTTSSNSLVGIPEWFAEFNVIATTNVTLPSYNDSYSDFEIKAGGIAHTDGSGARIGKRQGGWGGLGVEPHPDYPGGFSATGSPPTVIAFSPADDLTNVVLDAQLIATFSKPVQFGSGNIVLRENNGGWVNLEIFDVVGDVGSSAGQVEISGSTLTIHPSAPLVAGRQYAVRIAATALDDTDGTPNNFAGISDDVTWNFSAISTVPAMPADGQLILELTLV